MLSAVSDSSAGTGGDEKIKAQSPIIARAAIRKSCGRIVYDKILTVEPLIGHSHVRSKWRFL